VAALEIGGLTVRIGSAVVVDDVSLTTPEGRVGAIVGPLGSGKSTLLEAIAGLVPASAGTISVGGERLDGRSAPQRARLGICYLPPSGGVFPGLTVAENVAVMCPDDVGAVGAAFPELAARWSVRAGSLSGGEQRMLALVRALAPRTRVALFDEPFHALAPRAAASTAEMLARLAAEEHKVVLVTDTARGRVASIPNAVVVLHAGADTSRSAS
jgi:branched-chain amino acid transport system ATP-binding protein